MNEIVTTQEERMLGIYDDLDFNVYKKAPGVNNSYLTTFHKSAKLAQDDKYHPRPDTRDLRVGHAAHCLIFEPAKFEKMYIKAKYTEFRTDESKAWKAAAEEAGYFILKSSMSSEDPYRNPPEWDLVHRLRDAVMANPTAELLVKGCVFERSIFWVDKGVGTHQPTYKLCKARMDGYNEDHSMIVDLKTSNDASFNGFQKSCREYEYFRQVPWYTDGAKSSDVNLDVRSFVFIVVEKSPPFEVKLYKLDPNWVREGREIMRRDLEHYALCHKHNLWPGYGERVTENADGTASIINDGVRDLIQPNYAKIHPIY